MWQKLVVIAVALGLPAVALAVFYIGSMRYDGRFVKAELDGLEYVEPLNRLDELLTAQRGMLEASARWPRDPGVRSAAGSPRAGRGSTRR